jgi:universal stress protein E
MMNKSILAIIEPDIFPDDVARRAAWLAIQYGCDLELLLCDPVLTVLGDSFMVSNEAQQLADRIKQLQIEIIGGIAASVSSDDFKVEATVLHERPISDAIISKAMDSNPTFIVKGTTYHSPADRATFTYTDWRLIRKLQCPVWLVKGGEWKEHPVIVGAVDPTHKHDPKATIDQDIVKAGKVLATMTGGRLLLLHTYQRLVEIGSRAIRTIKPIRLSIDEIDKKTRESHRRQLDALAAAYDVTPDDVHQLPGRTREILPSFVRSHGADIVIMGAIARTGLKRRIVGSTAEQVLDHLPCDILLVRQD